MRRLAAAVLVLTVASVSAAAWDGSARAGARPVRPAPAARFAPLRAMAPELRAAVAGLLRPRGAPHARTVLIPPGAGTCYVGPGPCSEHPCIEYAVLRSTTAVISGLHGAIPNPRTRCSRSSGVTQISTVSSTSVAGVASAVAVAPAPLSPSR
ncbi:MAG: hypothetical protein ACR2GZ_05270 [Solirubrobacteraceae bacterium]